MEKVQVLDGSPVKGTDAKSRLINRKKRPRDAVTQQDDIDIDHQYKRNTVKQSGSKRNFGHDDFVPSNFSFNDENMAKGRDEIQRSDAEENDTSGKYSKNILVREFKIPCDDKNVLTTEGADKSLGNDDVVSPNITFSEDNGVKEHDEKQFSSADRNDKLEEYFESIYMRECKFSCDDKDVQFIQSGIETFVGRIVHMRFSNTKCRMSYCNIKHIRPELLMVGSYYENTKNKFPNEFDYIVVFGTVDELPNTHLFDHEFGKCIETNLTPIKNECSSLSFLRRLEYHGPAETYGFCFQKDGVVKTISVDISSALRYIYTAEIHELQNIVHTSKVFHPEFHRAILDTKSFLLLKFRDQTGINGHVTLPWKVSVTETEIKFIKENVSEKHKKVYMLLKYLINGNLSNDLLREFRSYFSLCISSYNIKTAVLYHHFKCSNRSSAVSDCVLDILWYFYDILSTCQTTRCPPFSSAMPDTLLQFQVKRCEIGYVPIETYRPDNHVIYAKTSYSTTTKTEVSPLIRASKRDIYCISKVLRLFVKRLEALRSTNFNKCSHMVNDSFIEMLLKCPTVRSLAETRLSEIYNSVLECIHLNKVPTVENKNLYKWLKTEEINKCPWCNYSSSYDFTLEATGWQKAHKENGSGCLFIRPSDTLPFESE